MCFINVKVSFIIIFYFRDPKLGSKTEKVKNEIPPDGENKRKRKAISK